MQGCKALFSSTLQPYQGIKPLKTFQANQL